MSKNPRKGCPVLSTVLGISVLLHLLDALIRHAGGPGAGAVPLRDLLALAPGRALAGGEIWRLFTFPFVHADTAHLVVNTFLLALLGRDLERLWGSRGFAGFLAAAAIGTGGAAAGLAWGDESRGMTGFVLAVFTAYALLFGDRRLSRFLRIRHAVWLGFAAAILSTYRTPGVPASVLLVPLGGIPGALAFLALRPRVLAAAAWYARRRRLLRRLAMRRVRQRMDFLLEKIQSGGIDSLKPRERRFLAEASRMYREEKGEPSPDDKQTSTSLVESEH